MHSKIMLFIYALYCMTDIMPPRRSSAQRTLNNAFDELRRHNEELREELRARDEATLRSQFDLDSQNFNPDAFLTQFPELNPLLPSSDSTIPPESTEDDDDDTDTHIQHDIGTQTFYIIYASNIFLYKWFDCFQGLHPEGSREKQEHSDW